MEDQNVTELLKKILFGYFLVEQPKKFHSLCYFFDIQIKDNPSALLFPTRLV